MRMRFCGAGNGWQDLGERTMERKWDCEPSINDLLDEPIVELVMRRDGVDREQLLALIARQRLDLDFQPVVAA